MSKKYTLLVATLLLAGCGQVQLVRPVDAPVSPETLTDYPNSGVACTAAGWQLSTTETGSQVCRDNLGRECELTDFVAGECTLGASLSEAALRCAEAGYTYDSVTSTCADTEAGTVCPAAAWSDGRCTLTVWLGTATFEQDTWQGSVTAEYAAGDSGFLLSASFRDLPELSAGQEYRLYLSRSEPADAALLGALTYDAASDWWTLEYSNPKDLTHLSQVAIVRSPNMALALSQGEVLATATWEIEELAPVGASENE